MRFNFSIPPAFNGPIIRNQSWIMPLAIFLLPRFSFPLLMALSFKLFGVGFESGFYVVRLFYVMNILLCYFLGKRFFNTETGVAVSLMVLTSYSINRASSFILLDNIIVFWLLFYFLLIHAAFEKNSFAYYISAGLVLSIAMLTKGVFAFWFLPLPLLLFVYADYRNKRYVFGVLLLYASFLSVLIPWIYNLVIGNIELKVLIGPLGDLDLIRSKGHMPLDSQKFSVKAFFNFMHRKWGDLYLFSYNYIDKLFVLSKLFYVGAVYSLYQAIVKRKLAHIILVSGILFFAPIIYVASNARGISFREGQLMLLWPILYFMFGAMIIDVSKIISKAILLKFKKQAYHKPLYLIITSVILVILIFYQFYVGTINNNGKDFYNLIVCKKVTPKNCFSYYRGDFKVG